MEPLTTHYALRTTGGLGTTYYALQVTLLGMEPITTHYALRNTHYALRTTGDAAGHGTTYYALRTTHHAPRATRYRRIASLLAARGVMLEFLLDEGLFVLDGALPGFRRPAALY